LDIGFNCPFRLTLADKPVMELLETVHIIDDVRSTTPSPLRCLRSSWSRVRVPLGPPKIKNVQKVDRLAQKEQLGGAGTYGSMSFSKTLVM